MTCQFQGHIHTTQVRGGTPVTSYHCTHPEIEVPFCVETQVEKEAMRGGNCSVCEGCPLRSKIATLHAPFAPSALAQSIPKSNFCYFTGTNRANDVPLARALLPSARTAGVTEDFHLFAPTPIEGFEYHRIDAKLPWRNHMAKIDFLRQLADTKYDYCVWLDTDNYFVRHPGTLSNLIRGNKCWISMEGEITSPNVRQNDWWAFRWDKSPSIIDIMRYHGCKGETIWSTNGGMWIVRREAITEFADTIEALWKNLVVIDRRVSDEPPLALMGQTMVPDPENNTVEKLSDVWACDWVGRYRDRLPDGNNWLYEDWLTGKQWSINPAIVHSMRGKDTVRAAMTPGSRSTSKASPRVSMESRIRQHLELNPCPYRGNQLRIEAKRGGCSLGDAPVFTCTASENKGGEASLWPFCSSQTMPCCRKCTWKHAAQPDKTTIKLA